MDFSIVVPFFNPEKFVERCIRGLLGQTYPADRYEILMVDNNSTDASVEIIRRYDRVKLLAEPEQGSYAARNRGIQSARGAIVAFTDPDCVPRPDWLEQIERAMKDPQTALVVGDREFASDAGVLGMLGAYESRLLARIYQTGRLEHFFAHTNNMAVRMPVLNALNGFQKLQRGADNLFMRQVAVRYGTPAVKCVPEMMVRHLEIASIGDYMEKKIVYGRLHRNADIRPALPLPLATRWKLARQACREQGGSLADTIGFYSVLAAGAVRFEWERWRKSGR